MSSRANTCCRAARLAAVRYAGSVTCWAARTPRSTTSPPRLAPCRRVVAACCSCRISPGSARHCGAARRAAGGEGRHGLGLYALAAQATGLGGAGETVEHLLTERTSYEPDPGRHAR